MAGENLVFLDETSLNTAMHRLHGRGKRGERVMASSVYKRKSTITFIMAIRHDGLFSPCTLNGALTGDAFATYLETFLLPLLKPNDCVIMDNLPAHKVTAARKVFADNNIQHLYLPPYSPDFNPIEFAFSPFKAHLRKAGANSIKDLENETVKAMDKITADQCKNCFLAQGYKISGSTH